MSTPFNESIVIFLNITFHTYHISVKLVELNGSKLKIIKQKNRKINARPYGRVNIERAMPTGCRTQNPMTFIYIYIK